MKYKEIDSLFEYVKEVEAKLFSEENRRHVNHSSANSLDWANATLLADNHDILANAAGAANIYAIFVAPKNSDEYKLKYIGKTKAKLARQRFINHLIQKNSQTGSKLEYIKDHVLQGGSVKLSWVKIQPESLRNYIEEELISRHKEAVWNKENSKNGK